MHTKIAVKHRKMSLGRLCVNVTIILQCILEKSVVQMSHLFLYVRRGVQWRDFCGDGYILS
jgi:hypothetical protein